MQCPHDKSRGALVIESARPKSAIISLIATTPLEAVYPQSLEFCVDCGSVFVPTDYLPKPAEASNG